MTLTVDLTQEELARVAEEARRTGKSAPTVLRNHHLPPLEMPVQDPTLALFEQWDKEDAKRTDADVAQEAEFWKEFRSSLNEVRRASGLREI